MATTTKAGAKQQPTIHPMVALREQLHSRLDEFRMALPAHMPPEKFVRVVMTACALNVDLIAVNRQTFFNACMRAANDGLLPDGREGTIVAFADNSPKSPTYRQQIAVWMPMVGGLLKRFRNSGQFKSVSVDVVREGEEFKYWKDEHGEHLYHSPGDGGGKVIKAYAMAETKDGGVMIKVMSAADIEKRRAISRAKDGPMWGQWWEEAALKTVLRNLHKRLPASSDDLDHLMRRDDDDGAFDQVPSERQHERELVTGGVMGALDHFGGAQQEPPPTQPEPPPPDDVQPDNAA
jgi:recombination protein RecT